MALSGIISVSGIPGLQKVLTQTKTGLIVESLLDGKRRPIYSTQKVSALEDISIYTYSEDVPLVEIFQKIHEKEAGKKSLDHKTDAKKLRDYLTDIVDDLDQEKVYNSDISKLFQWYNLLVDKDLMNFEEEEEDAGSEVDDKPVKAAKKAPAKKKTTAATAKSPKPKASAPAKKATQTTKASGRKS
jgi:hypothetical protein